MRHIILPAKLADAADILALQRLAYESEARLYGDWTIPPLTQTLEELRAEFDRLVILKAVAGPGGDGPLLGSVRAGLDGGVCRIGRLIVRPEAQGRGLGTALLRAVEAHFPPSVRFSLFTGARSEGNLRLYQRLGYQPVREEVVSPALTLIFLEKSGLAAR